MTEKADPDFYGRKMATIDQLMELINDGDEASRDELQTRLPAELAALQQLYQLAYGNEANHALLRDMQKE